MMMRLFHRLRAWLEFLEGATESPPTPISSRWISGILGVWWALLAALIAVFSGQTSKFIYIDF